MMTHGAHAAHAAHGNVWCGGWDVYVWWVGESWVGGCGVVVGGWV